MKWVHRLFLIATLAPILVWVGALVGTIYFSGVEGCRIDEGNIHPCEVFGTDRGELAYQFGFYASWGILILGPISIGIGLLWATVALTSWVVRRRRAARGRADRLTPPR